MHPARKAGGAAVAAATETGGRGLPTVDGRPLVAEGLAGAKAQCFSEAPLQPQPWAGGLGETREAIALGGGDVGGLSSRQKRSPAAENPLFFWVQVEGNLDTCRFLSHNTYELSVLPVLGGFYRPTAWYCDGLWFQGLSSELKAASPPTGKFLGGRYPSERVRSAGFPTWIGPRAISDSSVVSTLSPARAASTNVISEVPRG